MRAFPRTASLVLLLGLVVAACGRGNTTVRAGDSARLSEGTSLPPSADKSQLTAVPTTPNATPPLPPSQKAQILQFTNLTTGWIVYPADQFTAALAASSDGGATWATQGAPPPMRAVAMLSSANGMALRSGGSQYFRTADGGVNWVAQNLPASLPSPIWSLTPSTDGKAVWGLDRDDHAIETTDLGATWKRYDNPAATALCAISADRAVIANDAGLFSTSDGGATWQEDYKAPYGIADASLVCDDQVGYAQLNAPGGAGQSRSEVVASADGGKTWKVLAELGGPSEQRPDWLTGQVPGKVIGISPNHDAVVTSSCEGCDFGTWTTTVVDATGAAIASNPIRVDDAAVSSASQDIPGASIVGSQIWLAEVAPSAGDAQSFLLRLIRSDDNGQTWHLLWETPLKLDQAP